jgi:hypothetical protein
MWKAVAVGAVLGARAAVAQAPADSTTQVGPNNDPSQIVCVNERVTGSRVSSRRVCRTRAEWAEHEAEQRRTLEKTQSFRPTCEPKGRC